MFYYSMWGMSFFWWLFWAALLVVFFVTLAPIPRTRVRFYEHPLAILQRRYAAGEITSAEYEERKARLKNDTAELLNARRAASAPRQQPSNQAT
jgi:putative membrane protein